MSPRSDKRGPHIKQAWEAKRLPPKSLAGRIRAARFATGMTVRELAPHTTVSYGTIAQIENATTDPKVPVVQAVLDGLRKLLGTKKYLEYFPPTLDLVALKGQGKVTEQLIDYPPPPEMTAETKTDFRRKIKLGAVMAGTPENSLDKLPSEDAKKETKPAPKRRGNRNND